MKEILSRMELNEPVFYEYFVNLICENKEIALSLLATPLAIFSKLNILDDFVPLIKKYMGNQAAIHFLENLEKGPNEFYNLLIKLFIEETISGRMPPAKLRECLSQKKVKYDPDVVLNYFPRGYMNRERCFVLDMLERY